MVKPQSMGSALPSLKSHPDNDGGAALYDKSEELEELVLVVLPILLWLLFVFVFVTKLIFATWVLLVGLGISFKL